MKLQKERGGDQRKMSDDFEWIKSTFAAAFTPKKLVPIDEWVDEGNIMLPSNTPEPGVYSLKRTPYQREVLRKLSPEDPTKEVVLCFGSQTGKTTVELATMSYYIAISPAPICFAFSDDRNLTGFVRYKFDPLLASNPNIRQLLKSEGKSSADTQTGKQFPGGFLKFLSGKSEASMRSDSIRVAIADEVDAVGDTDGGDVRSLLRGRQTTFGDSRKMCLSSTPKGGSRIFGYLKESTFNKYYVRCPHCGEYMLFEMSNFRWERDGNTVKRAWMDCPNCHAEIKNENKLTMLYPEYGAEWRPTQPDRDPAMQGYYLPSFYAPVGWISWLDLAKEYCDAAYAKGGVDHMKMTTFVNTRLGLPYETGETADLSEAKTKEAQESPYMLGDVPEWVNFITTGSDVQANRIETEVIGWGYRGRHIIIDYKIFHVPQDEDITIVGGQAWCDYKEQIIEGRWIREDGLSLISIANAMDSGYHQEMVYGLYLELPPDKRSRFYPVKGSERLTGYMSLQKEVRMANFTGARWWQVPVSELKHAIYRDLAEKDDSSQTKPFICFFPRDLTPEYFLQLYAEQWTLRGTKYIWEKRRDRNEALDVTVYNYAMYHLTGLAQLSDDDWVSIANSQSEVRDNINEVKAPVRKQHVRRQISKGFTL